VSIARESPQYVEISTLVGTSHRAFLSLLLSPNNFTTIVFDPSLPFAAPDDFLQVLDEKLQAEEQNNYIKFYLIEENSLIELNELSEESVEYNCRNSRRYMGN
jgi:hypothetical protein